MSKIFKSGLFSAMAFSMVLFLPLLLTTLIVVLPGKVMAAQTATGVATANNIPTTNPSSAASAVEAKNTPPASPAASSSPSPTPSASSSTAVVGEPQQSETQKAYQAYMAAAAIYREIESNYRAAVNDMMFKMGWMQAWSEPNFYTAYAYETSKKEFEEAWGKCKALQEQYYSALTNMNSARAALVNAHIAAGGLTIIEPSPSPRPSSF